MSTALATIPAKDLAPAQLVQAEPLYAVVRRAIAATEKALGRWEQLEPMIDTAIKSLQAGMEADADAPQTPLLQRSQRENLTTIARVLDLMSKTGVQLSKTASEAAALADVVGVGLKKDRPEASGMSQKDLAGVVIEAAKKFAKDMEQCPVCNTRLAPVVTVDAE